MIEVIKWIDSNRKILSSHNIRSRIKSRLLGNSKPIILNILLREIEIPVHNSKPYIKRRVPYRLIGKSRTRVSSRENQDLNLQVRVFQVYFVLESEFSL